MARDPVCGIYVDEEHTAFTAEVDGKTYYFCSEGCMLTFIQSEVAERFTALPRREEIERALNT